MKKAYVVHVQEPYFTHIKNGIKKVEGRINKSKFAEMNIGDQILLNEDVELEIVNKTAYISFKDMLSFEGFKNVIPDAKNIGEAESVYYAFYTKEDEAQYGVIAIEVKVL